MDANFGSLSFLLGYLLMILGDGCLLVAATVAASSGGSPIRWGTAFGLAHGIFTLFGLFVASTIAASSELLGHLVVLFALVYLLRHFISHRTHHRAGSSHCGCLEHHQAPTSFIWGLSFALSIHALASGAVLQQAFPGTSIPGYLTVAACSAIFSGLLIGLVVRFSEEYRSVLIRFFDAAPSLTVGLLSSAILFVTIDIISESLRGDHIHSLTHTHSHTAPTVIACIGGALIAIFYRAKFRKSPTPNLDVTSSLVSIRRGS